MKTFSLPESTGGEGSEPSDVISRMGCEDTLLSDLSWNCVAYIAQWKERVDLYCKGKHEPNLKPLHHYRRDEGAQVHTDRQIFRKIKRGEHVKDAY